MLEGDGGNIEDLSQTAEPISSQPDSSSAPSEHVTKATKPTIFGKVPKKLESRLNFNEYKKMARCRSGNT